MNSLMGNAKAKLELTWVGKDERVRLERCRINDGSPTESQRVVFASFPM